MSFSERNKLRSIRTELQTDNVDIQLRNSLWNGIYTKLQIFYNDLYEDIICDFFKETLEISNSTLDFFDDNKAKKLTEIKQKFFKLQWFEIYDFIEFLVSSQFFKGKESHIKKHLNELKTDINRYLEREFSAYRLVDDLIIRIIDEVEIKAIEDALILKNKKHEPIQTHMQASLKKLSDKKNPDYRNSIKESISGVEACCRLLTGENTLGKALDKLDKSGISVNTQLKQGFDKLYAYTNSKDSGIRHAIIENGNEPDFEDAKYMLVSCSAFINYLISKTK
jgi:hypothetical protein